SSLGHAQNDKVLEVDLFGSMSFTHRIGYEFDNPKGGTINILYNVKSHYAIGLSFQRTSMYYANHKFAHNKVIGKYRFNPNSRIVFLAGVSMGMTSVKVEVKESYFDYDEAKFTIGLYGGLEIKLSNTIGLNFQVSHEDILGAFSEEYMIYDFLWYDNFTSNNERYLVPENQVSNYVPLYINGGFSIKMGRKKL
ncbi:outer membrane beta-barrel protein, partial [Fulvivirga aurantia]|uniref:outer membrane beta-barrel protein n=1 Tax=Fulvivirga aurantia TaxID=2529383 RepID=UPI001628C469